MEMKNNFVEDHFLTSVVRYSKHCLACHLISSRTRYLSFKFSAFLCSYSLLKIIFQISYEPQENPLGIGATATLQCLSGSAIAGAVRSTCGKAGWQPKSLGMCVSVSFLKLSLKYPNILSKISEYPR